MKVIKKIDVMQAVSKRCIEKKNTIGFVPTMGALHKGHLSLIQRARSENDIVIISLFVNPKQFTSIHDLNKYPHTLKEDIKLVNNDVDYVFVPTVDEMYPPDFQTSLVLGSCASDLEGEFRPGHFAGMATVVHKLINICRPTRAYFGLKDYQQFIVVSQMVKDLHIDTQIVGCPTVRESSGLALSSRNMRLSSEEKKNASQIYQVLSGAKDIIQKGARNPQIIEKYLSDNLKKIPKSKIEYVSVRSANLKPIDVIPSRVVLLVALSIGSVRLIDNCIIHC